MNFLIWEKNTRASIACKAAFSLLLFSSLQISALELSLWSEFIPYSEVETHLETLSANETNLIVAFSEVKESQPGFSMQEFCHLHKAAKKLGVQVRPWLLLREEDGYWFNKWNFEQAREFVHQFVRRFENACGFTPAWLTFDMETPPQMLEELRDGKKRSKVLKESSLKGSIQEAIKNYASLVQDMNDQGIQVHGVTSNLILHEPKQDHFRMQDAFAIPFETIPWNEASYMAYRAEFEQNASQVFPKNLYDGKIPFSSGIVYDYAKRVKKRWADKAAIDLGEIGHVPFPRPGFDAFMNPKEIQSDIIAAIQAGVDKIHIYSLDGILKTQFADQNLNSILSWVSAQELLAKLTKPREFSDYSRVDLPSWLMMRVLDYGAVSLPESD